jgi:hypothetical protein
LSVPRGTLCVWLATLTWIVFRYGHVHRSAVDLNGIDLIAVRRDELPRHTCQPVGVEVDGFADAVQKAVGVLFTADVLAFTVAAGLRGKGRQILLTVSRDSRQPFLREHYRELVGSVAKRSVRDVRVPVGRFRPHVAQQFSHAWQGYVPADQVRRKRVPEIVDADVGLPAPQQLSATSP